MHVDLPQRYKGVNAQLCSQMLPGADPKANGSTAEYNAEQKITSSVLHLGSL